MPPAEAGVTVTHVTFTCRLHAARPRLSLQFGAVGSWVLGFNMDDSNDEDKIFWRLSSKEPIGIYLHPNLGLSVSTALSKKIKKYGGDPKATEDEAEVIICRKDGPVFSVLTKKYDHDRYKWVEPPLWVDACISEKKYQHPVRPPVLRSRPGGRSQFTVAEDAHIVQFLAKRIPWRDMKGRSGQSVWKDLCSRTDIYPWAASHSWQSWRERYVKNSALFDDRIEEVVLADPDPPVRGGKGQYRVEYGKPGPRNRPKLNGISCRVDDEEEEGEEIDIDGQIAKRKATGVSPFVEIPPLKRRRIEAVQREEEEEEQEEQVETAPPGPSNVVPEPITSIAEPVAPTPAPSVVPPERSISPPLPHIASIPSSPSSSSAPPSPSQHPLPGTSSFRQKSNILTVVPVTSPSRTRSRPTVPDQTATVLDNNNDPPALRTRARSRQASIEPPAQPVEQPGRLRRTRATASPVPPPPPPPTLATQPEPVQMIDFDQLRTQRRGAKKIISKPALIPIPETSENTLGGSTNLSKKRTEASVQDIPRVQDGVPVKSKVAVVASDDDDDDDDVQLDDRDLGLDSSDDMSVRRSFNEGMKAITGRGSEKDTNEKNQTPPPQPHLASFRRARKLPHTQRRGLIPGESEGSGSESGSESENESENDEDIGIGDNQLSKHSSLDSETSVPAVGTNARKYFISRTPFTPARGTLAQKHVEGRQWDFRDRKVDKGKGRA